MSDDEAIPIQQEYLWPDPQRGPYLLRLTMALAGDRFEVVGVELWGAPPPEWDVTVSGDPEAVRFVTWDEVNRRKWASAGAGPTPIRSTDVRLPLDRLAQDVLTRVRRFTPMIRGDRFSPKAKRMARRLERPTGGSYVPSHFEEVAKVYKAARASAAKRSAPTSAVAESFQVSKSTAAKWVAKARALGFLPPTSRGRCRRRNFSARAKRKVGAKVRGHIREHGKGWAVIVDEGSQPARRCAKVPACKGVRIWSNDDATETCPKCGGPLGPARSVRRQRWQSYRTKGKAESGLTEVLGKLGRDEYVPPTKITVGEYVRNVWLPHLADRVVMGNLRPTTVEQYRALVETHVLPHLGAVPLRSLTPSRLDSLYGELLRSGRKPRIAKAPRAAEAPKVAKAPPPGLSCTHSVRAVHVTISAFLRHAVRKGVLARNVAALAEPPRPAEREQAIWTAEQTAHFLSFTSQDRLAALYVVAATAGLRRGELAGLRWEDVDLDRAKLTVAGARVVVGYRVVESAPKTAKGKRTIAIAPITVDALRAYRARQREERLSWGPAWTDSGLVFTKEDGAGLHPQYVTWAFQRQAKRAGLPVLPLHALRHGHATAGLRAGVGLHAMSRRLGHSSVAITGDTYSHVVEELDVEAASLTADLVTPSRRVAEGG